MAKLKVFTARLGFFETIVAASSQKSALEAWGTHQDLFKDGGAAITTDADAVQAATAQPGVVLRRAVGAKGAFQPESEPPTDLPTPPPRRKVEAGEAGLTASPKPRPAPDRSRLTAAEEALARADANLDAALRDIDARRTALDAEETDLRAKAERERPGLQTAADRARAAYHKAGGAL